MAYRTTADQASNLMSRTYAQSRVSGQLSTEYESLAIFESIAFAMLLNPRVVLFDALAARDRLSSVCAEELALIDALTSAVNDLENPSYIVSDLSELENARTALLQIENLERVDASGVQFSRYNGAVNRFLESSLSKMVRVPGSLSMRRPAAEAQTDMGVHYTDLVSKHAELLDRLYSLAVGVSNFQATPLTTLLGTTTAARARNDIEQLISSFASSPTADLARDAVTRLITGRSALRVTGTPPGLFDPLIDTSSNLPAGYTLKGISPPTPAIATSGQGPFSSSSSMAMSVEVRGTVVSTPHLYNRGGGSEAYRSFLVGEEVSWPVTVPPGYFLFVDCYSGLVKATTRVVLNSTALPMTLSLSDVATAIRAANDSLWAGEFVGAGLTSRLFIEGEYNKISIASSAVEYGAIPAPFLFTTSAHALLGFSVGQTALEGVYTYPNVLDAIQATFQSLISASPTGDQEILVSTLDTAAGVEMNIDGTPALGLVGNFKAYSNQVGLYGTTPTGVILSTDDPLYDARGLVNPGDTVTIPTGTTSVSAVGDFLELAASLQTFDGPITVRSAVVLTYQALDEVFQPFADSWLKTKFAKDLVSLDRVLATLVGSQTLPRRNSALSILEELRSQVDNLSQLLQGTETVLPAGSSAPERELFKGIVIALADRKYDAALDLLEKCRLYELFKLTHETASHGGSVLNAISDFVRSDMQFPDATHDEADVPNLTVDRSLT